VFHDALLVWEARRHAGHMPGWRHQRYWHIGMPMVKS
jgi:hypothetical protein